MSAPYRYKNLEKLRAWKVIDHAIEKLVANGDVEELTARKYLVGYLLEQLKHADLLAAENGANGEACHSTSANGHNVAR